MKLNVRNKIWLGTGFLFLLLILSGGIGIYYMLTLKRDAKNILRDNYESLAYCHTMQTELDNLEFSFNNSIKIADSALIKQENNITEPGEQNHTQLLRQSFNKLKQGDTSRRNIEIIQQQIQSIITLNMHAIEVKNSKAETTASNALQAIIVVSCIVFIIAFTFIFNFPSIVTNPISQLTKGIEEIADKNYKYRIHINNKDEFGSLANSFNSMAKKLEFFESSNLNKIMFEKTRAEAVINSLKDASIGISADNKILFANQQALQLLGVKAESIIGRNADDLKQRNDLFRFLSGDESNTPFKIVVDNRENYFTKESIEVEQEGKTNKVIILKNITSFKELDTAKTNFIATVSHELKTPLAASDFSLKLLQDERNGSLNNEQKELIHHLKEDNQRMLKILSELLNMAQVEAGKIQLNIKVVNPKDILEQAVKANETSAKQQNIQLIINSQNPIKSILADADKTVWVLNNFLSNAIKYGGDNKHIIIKIIEKENAVVFIVIDEGEGINKNDLPHVFERFYRVDGNKKGTGLGLAISKEFIEIQNGKIWAESEEGKGSAFAFSLPVA